MTGICRNIVLRAVAGLSAAVLAVTATLAQAPRSVTILPDIPEAPAATRVPDISSRLMLLNSTAATHGLRDTANLIKPGRPLTIPQLGTPHGGANFVADLPAGIAMVVALLSDKPVQVVDLPDTPPPGFAPGDTLKYVRDQARTLKVPNPDGGRLEQPNWSIDGKFYLIK